MLVGHVDAPKKWRAALVLNLPFKMTKGTRERWMFFLYSQACSVVKAVVRKAVGACTGASHRGKGGDYSHIAPVPGDARIELSNKYN